MHPFMITLSRRWLLAALACAALHPAVLVAGTVVISGAGADRASIQDEVDAYRAALGPNNGAAAAPFPSGRREINWDGVPDPFAAPNDMPADLFAGRGALFGTPGTAVRVSADADNAAGAPVRFGDVNPTYAAAFRTFSDERLFSPIGSNIVDLTFVVPGSDTPGLVSGFGAVYTDADSPETSFEYLDAAGESLGVFQVPAADYGLSFLGVVFDTPSVRRVRIAYGTNALGPDEGPGVDVAVMDDFIFGESQPIPLPPAAGMA